MASVTWTATTSGTWSNDSDWSVATGPLTGDDVTIPGTAGPITVTYNAGSLKLDSLTTQGGASLAVTAGTLNVTNGYSINGSLSELGGLLRLVAGNNGSTVQGAVALSAGTLQLVGGAAFNGTSFNQTGGTLQIDRGALVDNESFSTLAGTVSGTGALILNGTSTTLAAGFALSTGAVSIQNGTVYLNENLTYGHDFTLAQSGTLNLGNSTLTLTGLGSLNGTIASSVLNLSGTGHFNGLTLENGTLLSLTGTFSQTGQINLGQTGTGTLSVASGGALRITGNDAIYNGNTGGVLVNAGTIIKTGGSPSGGVANIYATLNNTGTINAALGTIAFSGPTNGGTSTLGGTITGAGTVAFETGNYAITSNAFVLTAARTLLANSASITLTSTGLTYGGSFDQTGGTLVVGTPGQQGGSTLTLTGPDAFDGGLLKGTGTVLCSGAVNLGGLATLEGNLTFDFGTSQAATVSQTGSILLGSELDAITTANIGAKESWLIKGASSSILGANGTINNAGLFEKLSGAGTSVVQNSIFNTGTLLVNTGMLTLSGGGSLGGSVTGSAALDITGNLAFASGLSLTVGETILDGGQITLGGNITYANDWSEESGTLALGVNTLTLSGVTSLASGAIEGPGAVVVNGSAVIGQGPIPVQAFGLLQGAQLVLNGNTEQSGTLSLTGGSAAPTLTVGSSATYTLDAGAEIGAPNSSVIGTLVVGGTLSASGAGTSTVTAYTVDNGTIKVSGGDLVFMGPVSGTGSIALSNGGTVELDANALAHVPVDFGAGSSVLSLGQPNEFSGTIGGFAGGDVIELQGFAFANLTPVISGNTVTLTEASGQSATLTFSTAQTGSLLTLGEGPHGGLTLIHL